jgi:hypothetical protein
VGAALPHAPGGHARVAPGELLAVRLEWRAHELSASSEPLEVALLLQTTDGTTLLESARPLLYGALPPQDWAGETMQHIQTLALPAELPPGAYQLAVGLRSGQQDLAQPAVIDGALAVDERAGQVIGERGYFVPAALLQAWDAQGGLERAGEPVMLAVSFAGALQQCFQRACLRLGAGGVERLPVGELAWLADAGLPRAPAAELQDDPQLLAFWRAQGGEMALGPLEGHPIVRFGYITQYTRYARLERWYEGGPARLGDVGLDVLRLPAGTPYRWP